jgi:hypothetical protein
LERGADCQSAIRQISNLRYNGSSLARTETSNHNRDLDMKKQLSFVFRAASLFSASCLNVLLVSCCTHPAVPPAAQVEHIQNVSC